MILICRDFYLKGSTVVPIQFNSSHITSILTSRGCNVTSNFNYEFVMSWQIECTHWTNLKVASSMHFWQLPWPLAGKHDKPPNLNAGEGKDSIIEHIGLCPVEKLIPSQIIIICLDPF